MINKHEVMQNYLSDAIKEFLHFNSVIETENHASLNPIFSEYDRKIYTNGDRVRSYDFGITIIKPHDQGTNTINTDSIFDVEGFMKWVALQNKRNNLPNFGKDCTVMQIENLQDMPNLAGTNEDQTLCKYMFQCRVIYLQERGEY
ncbi:MAG: hypothetical protein RSB96_01675 [Oscillospiraceae bacterium]